MLGIPFLNSSVKEVSKNGGADGYCPRYLLRDKQACLLLHYSTSVLQKYLVRGVGVNPFWVQLVLNQQYLT